MHIGSRHWALIAAVVALSPFALATTTAQAQATGTNAGPHTMHHSDWQHGGHWRDDQRAMHMLDQLDLTASQRTNIRKLMQQDRAAAGPERQALMDKRKAFASATPGTNDYNTATSALAKAESQAAEARVTRHANLRAKIYAELTPAQRTKLASLRAQRQQRMQKQRESHPKPMQHPTQPAESSAPAH